MLTIEIEMAGGSKPKGRGKDPLAMGGESLGGRIDAEAYAEDGVIKHKPEEPPEMKVIISIGGLLNGA